MGSTGGLANAPTAPSRAIPDPVGTDPGPPEHRWASRRTGAGGGLLAAVLAGLLVVECLHEGGFWPGDAGVVAVASLVILTTALVALPPQRSNLLVVGAIAALAGWWLLRAATTGDAAAFLPLGASMIGFAASFVTVRALGERQREGAAVFVAALGGAAALVGFAGLAWRWFPMAMPAQGLWRLSTALTYSDAAGLFLAVCLLVALGCRPDDRVTRVAVCLCAGGLIASQSRGALLAFAVACAIVPRARYRSFAVPLLAGVALGVAAAATSAAPTHVDWLAAATLGAMGVAVIGSARRPRLRMATRVQAAVLRPPVRNAVAAALVVLVLGAGAVLLHHELALRVLAPSDQDRRVEWGAALRQFLSAPLVGVGPDRLLRFVAPDGTYAHFAHNEYLQVAADAGLLGVAALVAAGAGVARLVRRVDALSSAATAALVCWAVGGLFDFDWHLSVIGLLGGWVAGLAARRT